MPRLRLTALLSVLAVLLGVIGTALLSDWPRLHGGSAMAAWIAEAPSAPPPTKPRRMRAAAAASHPAKPSPRPPSPLFTPSPRYPIQALRAHREGVVTLRVQLDAGGHVATVEVARSSGDPQLDAAAQDAVRRWTFQLHGATSQPPRPMLLPVSFRIGA
ncbi:MAG TPA: energy transducer TonB [Rhodanobacteraceae bacterium]|jgi:protein TonB|nr:energy transducer TonB [Rhodanobacteraceae bacterium]